MINHPDKPFWEQPESRRLEFKEQFPKGNQVAKTAVAFANGGGGKIVFGIKNAPLKVVGISDHDLFKLEEQIANHIFSECAPTIVPEIYVQSAKGKNLLVVEIFPGSLKPYYLKSSGKQEGAYIRIGSTNKKASPEMLEELGRQQRKISFDGLPVYSLALKNVNLLPLKTDYVKATNRVLDDRKQKNLGLICCEGGRSYPTNAAVLLSDSQALQSLFPFAKVECARFKGTDTRVFLDQASITGPVHKAVEPCIAFIKKNISLSSRIGEVYRTDRWEYPLSAIRETIINAIIHRDYSILGSDIKVAIFDDMLEITSPGPLPDTMPVEELGTGRSEIRNRILAPVFKDLKLIESWGTGIRKIRDELQGYPDIELVLREIGHAFQVQFVKKKPAGTRKAKTGQVPDKYRTSTGQVPDKVLLLDFCRESRSSREMMAFLKLKHRETFIKNYLQPLMQDKSMAMTIPDKPRSAKQRYITTEKGLKKIEQ